MLKSEQKKPKLLLHACCGVCSAYIPKLLLPDYEITIYYENSNIYPEKEFDLRAEAAEKMAEHYKIPFIRVPQRQTDWYTHVRGFATAKERGPRCERCILFRLDDAFQYAKEHKFDIVACTLSVGRAKDSEMINRIGRAMSQKYDIPFLDKDWKKKGGEEYSQQVAKEKEIYRQDYCGCVYSKTERDKQSFQKTTLPRTLSFFIVGILSLSILSGCSITKNETSRAVGDVFQRVTEEQREEVFAWTSVSQGIERAAVVVPQDEWNAQLILYRFNPEQFVFGFANDEESPKQISEWREEMNALYIINGVYFHEDYSPSGLLRIDGENQGDRKFDFERTGIISFGSEPLIIDTSAQSMPNTSMVAQSYPFLLKNGKVDISEDSGKIARRSFVATDSEGKVILGVFAGGELSLYALAQELNKLPVEWKNVMNLDGGPSTGFSSRVTGSEEIVDSFVSVPNILYVKKRE